MTFGTKEIEARRIYYAAFSSHDIKLACPEAGKIGQTVIANLS